MRFLLITLAFFAFPFSAAAETQLLLPGEWHGNEVRAADWEHWLGVVSLPDAGWMLREFVLRVEAVEDPIIDEPGEMTGKKVRMAEGAEPLFLVRGLDGLSPGKITAVPDAPAEIALDHPLRLELPGGTGLDLSLDCRNPAFDATGIAECPLYAADGKGRQVLATFTLYRPEQDRIEFAAEANPRLLWAGDLDRDGRIDLLIDLSNHYNISSPALFLSSPAKGDEKLRKVAEFVTTGC
jgi:hypothetical protein